MLEAFGTEAFTNEYYMARAGDVGKSGSVKHNSFRALCIRYFASAKFEGLDVSTRGWQRRALEDICERHGDGPLAAMKSVHVRKLGMRKNQNRPPPTCG